MTSPSGAGNHLTLPCNLQWLDRVRQHRAAEIAGYAAARRLNVPEYTEQVAAHLTNLLRDVIPYRRDKAASISIIFSSGKYRTLFETGASGGLNDEALRQRLESLLFDYPSNHPASNRPIYGYFDPSPDGQSDPEPFVAHYGLIATRFRSSLREYATFTVGDTMDETHQAIEPNIAALPLSKPGWEAVSPKIGDALDYATVYDLMRRIEDTGSYERGSTVGYIEAQFHYGVRLADVEELIFYADSPRFQQVMDEAKTYSISYRVIK